MTQEFTFAPAVRRQKRLRITLDGPAGSGKTATALRLARCLFPDGRIALIDTEGGSAAAYACNENEAESIDGLRFRFDHLVLHSYSPDTYVRAIEAAERAEYTVIVIDSLSHAWAGKDGAMEQLDKVRARQRQNSTNGRDNSFTAWAEVTPMHNRLIDAMLQSSCHVIATMRSHVDYALDGNNVPHKIGMAPVQREGMDYEFDVVGELDEGHVLTVTKTRCQALDGSVLAFPGENMAMVLRAWIDDGAPALKSPRELIEAVGAGFARMGITSEDKHAELRLRRAGALQELLGERPTEAAIVAWLHAHDDDTELLLAGIASRLGLEYVAESAEPQRIILETEPAPEGPVFSRDALALVQAAEAAVLSHMRDEGILPAEASTEAVAAPDPSETTTAPAKKGKTEPAPAAPAT